MIYTLTLNPSLDYTMTFTDLIPGAVNRSSMETISFGGKGLNVCYVLNELGHPSLALGFLAGFTGKEIENATRSAGLQSDFIYLPQGLSRINVKLKSAHETDLNAQGPTIPDTCVAQLFSKLDKLEPNDILVLAGSVPPSLPETIYESLLRFANARSVLCVVDTTKAQFTGSLAYHPFLVKPNHHELGELFGKTLTSTKEVAYYAQRVQEMGAQNVLVSMAGEGALLIDPNGTLHKQSAPRGQVIDSVGAGDSMIAGFLAGFLDTGDHAYALSLGTAAGSATAFSPTLATKEQIFSLFRTL